MRDADGATTAGRASTRPELSESMHEVSSATVMPCTVEQNAPDVSPLKAVALLRDAAPTLSQEMQAGPPLEAQRLVRLYEVREGPRYYGHRPLHRRVGKGNAVGSRRALALAHTFVLLCEASRCTALVDLQAARRRARAEGRAYFATGDGCGSRTCSRNFRPGQFQRRQIGMASGLLRGVRRLICWPIGVQATEVWQSGHREMRRAAARATAALGTV